VRNTLLVILALISFFRLSGSDKCDSLVTYTTLLKEAGSPSEAALLLQGIEDPRQNFDCDDQVQLRKYYLAASMAYFDLGNFNEVLSLTADSLIVMENDPEPLDYIRLLSIRAATYGSIQEATKAVPLYEKAIAYSIQNDSIYYFKLVLNMAVSLDNLGRYNEAVGYYRKVIQHFRQSGEQRALAIAYNNVGEIYRDRFKDFEAAHLMYHKAMRLNKQEDNLFDLAKNYNNLGLVHGESEAYDSAIYYLDKAIDLNKQIGNELSIIKVRYNLGSYYLKTGDLKRANQAFRTTLKESKAIGLQAGIYYGYLGLAGVHTERQNYLASEKLLQLLNDSVEQQPNASMSESYIDVKLRNLKGLKRFEEALVFYEKADALIDSVDAFKNEQNALMLRAEYQAELDESEQRRLKAEGLAMRRNLAKEREQKGVYLGLGVLVLVLLIVSLIFYGQKQSAYRKQKRLNKTVNNKNTELGEAQAQLSAELDMKDRILSVLGHDLRAPFASIASMLNVLNDQVLSLEEAKPITKQLGLEVEQTLNTLANILNWSRLRLSGNGLKKEQFNLAEVFDEVFLNVSSAAHAKEITLKSQVEQKAFIEADPNQVRSILGNLLNNALKFSHIGGVVILEHYSGTDYHYLKIIDEGIGMSKEALDALNKPESEPYSTVGTAGEKGTGIGLSLVRDFINLHNGQLAYYTNKPSGTVVEVKLPK
jgi:signal transduction histidine kinase